MGDQGLSLTIVSDYICPWCYIGLARAERLQDELEIDVTWRPHELHPETPPEGRDLGPRGPRPEGNGAPQSRHDCYYACMSREVLAPFALVLGLFALASCGDSSGPGGSCSGETGRGGETRVESIDVGGVTRSYRVHVPSSYDGVTAMPLVVNLHGIGGTAAFQEVWTAMSKKSEEPAGGFIVAYPQGTLANGLAYWNDVVRVPAPGPDDIAFSNRLLDDLEAQLCVDENRVYATGFSNGAQMSVRLACSMPTRIAAIAPVAGVYYPPAIADQDERSAQDVCESSRPIPIIAFHGTDDSVVPFQGGWSSDFDQSFRLPISDEEAPTDVMREWAAHNGCVKTREETVVSDEVLLIAFGQCAANADVLLYEVLDGGHTWPGADDAEGDVTTGDISATDLIWEFFQAHPLSADDDEG